MKNFLIVLGFVLTFLAGYLFSKNYNFKLEQKTPAPTPTIEVKVTGSTTENRPTPTTAPVKSDEELIKAALVVKHGWNSEDIVITVSKNDGQFARGSVKEKTSETGGGMFLAKKIGGQWEIVFDGNGAPDCVVLKTTYSFPKEMLVGVCD